MKVIFSNRMILLVAALSGVALILINDQFFGKPREREITEVPVAFWAWRTQAPNNIEVQKAFTVTNAKTLFLRAGQFDLVNGEGAADSTAKRPDTFDERIAFGL